MRGQKLKLSWEFNENCQHNYSQKGFGAVMCSKCGQVLYDYKKDEDKEKRRKLCEKGIHKYIAERGAVYCKFCGEVKENVGYAAFSGGRGTLVKGKYSDEVWKH